MTSSTTTGRGSWFSFCDTAAIFIYIAPSTFSEACIYKTIFSHTDCMLPLVILFNLRKLQHYQVQRQQRIQKCITRGQGRCIHTDFLSQLTAHYSAWMTFQSSFEALQLVFASPTSFLTLTSLCLYHPQLPSVQPCQDLSCLTKSSLALTRNTREPLLGSSKTYPCQSYVQCTHFWFNFIQQKKQNPSILQSHDIKSVVFELLEPSPGFIRWPLHYVPICARCKCNGNACVGIPHSRYKPRGYSLYSLSPCSLRENGPLSLTTVFWEHRKSDYVYWVLTLARLFKCSPREPTRWLNR